MIGPPPPDEQLAGPRRPSPPRAHRRHPRPRPGWALAVCRRPPAGPPGRLAAAARNSASGIRVVLVGRPPAGSPPARPPSGRPGPGLPSSSRLVSSSPATSHRCSACSLRRCEMNFATAMCRPVQGMTTSGSRPRTSSTQRRIRVSSVSSRLGAARSAPWPAAALRVLEAPGFRHRVALQERLQMPDDLDRDPRSRARRSRGWSTRAASTACGGALDPPCLDEPARLAATVSHGHLLPSLQDSLTRPLCR